MDQWERRNIRYTEGYNNPGPPPSPPASPLTIEFWEPTNGFRITSDGSIDLTTVDSVLFEDVLYVPIPEDPPSTQQIFAVTHYTATETLITTTTAFLCDQIFSNFSLIIDAVPSGPYAIDPAITTDPC